MAEKIKLGNGNWGVKQGGTLAYNDENGVFKAIELASSRASSATYVAESGIVADAEVGVPRIDWTNGVGGLLLEPQRRNLIPYSQDFTQTDWTSLSTATLTANYGVAPDGSTSSVLVTNSSGGGSEQLAEVVTITSGETYTVSFWVKRVTGSGVVSIIGIENIATPIAVTSEWQRFSVTATATTTSGRAYVRVDTSGDEVEVWGAQLEDNGVLGGGDYMTSYIRTNGSSVTRIADAVSGNSSLGQVINSSEGVLYAEMSALANDGTTRAISLDNGSTSVGAIIRFRPTTNEFQFLLKDSVNPDVGNTLILSDATQTNKFALKWKSGDITLWVNGVEELTASGTMNISGLTDISFSTFGTFYGKVKDLRVYDTALTDAELTTLTTL